MPPSSLRKPISERLSLSRLGGLLVAVVILMPLLGLRLATPLSLGALGLAVPLLFFGTLQTISRFRDRHPLWGRDVLYPVLLGLSNHLIVRWSLLVVGLWGLVGSLTQEGRSAQGHDWVMVLLSLCAVAAGVPWVWTALRLHLPRPTPRQQTFTLAEDTPGSLQPVQVSGVRVNEQGRLLILWQPGPWMPGSPFADPSQQVALPVQGIQIPEFQRQGDWLRQLSRAVVQRRTGGKNSSTIHDMPLYRLADGLETSAPVVLIETSYGDLQQTGRSGGRYAVLADALVRWGYAVSTENRETQPPPPSTASTRSGHPLGRVGVTQIQPHSAPAVPDRTEATTPGTTPGLRSKWLALGTVLFVVQVGGLLIWPLLKRPPRLPEAQVEALCREALQRRGDELWSKAEVQLYRSGRGQTVPPPAGYNGRNFYVANFGERQSVNLASGTCRVTARDGALRAQITFWREHP